MFVNRVIASKFKRLLSYPTLDRYLVSNKFCTTKPLIDLQDGAVIQYLEDSKQEYWKLKTNLSQNRESVIKLKEFYPVVKLLEERRCILDNLNNLDDMRKDEIEKDKDMVELLKEEKLIYEDILKNLDGKIIDAMFNEDTRYGPSETILEVSAGVGGQEAMLFAREIFDMYLKFAQFKKWDSEITYLDKTGIGGVKKATAVFSGNGAFELLKSEGGVHRVQRVPATERAGRLHTSTVTVAILLQPTEVELNIPVRDLKIETKRSSGAGGQHVNTTDSCVRVTYLPTGLTVECQTDRSQHQNKKRALQRLRAILYQQQQDKLELDEKSCRKSQVGLGSRNEKIRTYNYQHDRITDHRIGASGGTIHGIDNLMKGEESLEKLILKIKKHIKTQDVLQRIEAYRQNCENVANS